jgi:hypothetical protein
MWREREGEVEQIVWLLLRMKGYKVKGSKNKVARWGVVLSRTHIAATHSNTRAAPPYIFFLKKLLPSQQVFLNQNANL